MQVQEGTRHKYYYNKATKQSTWEKPEGFEEGGGGI
jgi:hypothetical protein